MDVKVARHEPLYAQWKTWFQTYTPIATASCRGRSRLQKPSGTARGLWRKALRNLGKAKWYTRQHRLNRIMRCSWRRWGTRR